MLILNQIHAGPASAAVAAAELARDVAEHWREALPLEVPPDGGGMENSLPPTTAAGELDRVVLDTRIEELTHRIG